MNRQLSIGLHQWQRGVKYLAAVRRHVNVLRHRHASNGLRRWRQMAVYANATSSTLALAGVRAREHSCRVRRLVWAIWRSLSWQSARRRLQREMLDLSSRIVDDEAQIGSRETKIAQLMQQNAALRTSAASMNAYAERCAAQVAAALGPHVHRHVAVSWYVHFLEQRMDEMRRQLAQAAETANGPPPPPQLIGERADASVPPLTRVPVPPQHQSPHRMPSPRHVPPLHASCYSAQANEQHTQPPSVPLSTVPRRVTFGEAPSHASRRSGAQPELERSPPSGTARSAARDVTACHGATHASPSGMPGPLQHDLTTAQAGTALATDWSFELIGPVERDTAYGMWHGLAEEELKACELASEWQDHEPLAMRPPRHLAKSSTAASATRRSPQRHTPPQASPSSSTKASSPNCDPLSPAPVADALARIEAQWERSNRASVRPRADVSFQRAPHPGPWKP